MAVAYEELEDSPQLRMDRRGGQATRRVKIAWGDIEALFLELFPNPFNGWGTAIFPGYPWLMVDSVTVEPFVPAPRGNNEPINVFDGGARVTVEYRPPAMEGGMQGGPRGDPSGPGGLDGSTGSHQGQDQVFVTHDIDVGGEFLTYPSQNFMWHYPAKNRIAANADIKEFEVTGDTVTGVIQPHIEHSISWHQVAFPPWQAIRQCMGKVNAYRFAGAPRGTLLFMGAKARKEFTNAGAKAWTMDYKISEKNYNAVNPKAPRGWNYFLRPDGWRAGQYELLHKKIPLVEILVDKFVIPTTTTTNQIGGATKIITVASDADFPAEGQFRITLRANNVYEVCEVTVHAGNNWTVLRGIDGSKVRDWAPGTTVQQSAGLVYDAADFRYLFLPGLVLRP